MPRQATTTTHAHARAALHAAPKSGRSPALPNSGLLPPLCFFFFFNDTATTEIYTLSLHDALPICLYSWHLWNYRMLHYEQYSGERSEEHTSELQSPCNLVCRLLLEKKKPTNNDRHGGAAVNQPFNAVTT